MELSRLKPVCSCSFAGKVRSERCGSLQGCECPGRRIAGRGETCGALIGGIMAIGQVIGRESLGDNEQFQKAMVPAGEMYERFKEAVGHTLCAEIHKILFGRSFRLYEEEEKKAFVAAGGRGPDGCPGVGSKAAKIAASIILDLKAGAECGGRLRQPLSGQRKRSRRS
jgi:C_GCAxxG_C_C family probable redox protein